MLEQAFTDIFGRIAAITKNTRNDMVLHQKVHVLQGSDKGVADETARIAVARRLLAENPAFQVPEAFDVLEPAQARMVLRKVLTDSTAYTGSELGDVAPSQEADAITAEFFGQWEAGGTTFLGTSSWGGYPEFKPRKSKGVSGPLTGTTFERGIIAIDSEKLVYVWVEEED